MKRTKIVWDGGWSILVIYSLILVSGFSCTEKKNRVGDNRMVDTLTISAPGVDSEGPYFTLDHEGYPVLVWSEKVGDDEDMGYLVKYARFSEGGDEISDEGEVAPSRGCSTTSESMNKIAFKKNGTMVSVFSRRTPTEENRFAGALFYSQSFDGGETWTSEKYLHPGDTSRGLSRSFFDLVTLPDGEIGAVWLDSRKTKNRGDGSTLFFSKTVGDSGFLTDQAIDSGTCECCRTNLFVSDNGDVHVLYRDIRSDSIRDISHVISHDNGRTFTDPSRISQDNWVIFGCPHTGPSMGETKEGLNVVWFTMGSSPGVYQTLYDQSTLSYSERALVTRDGTHPQVLTTVDGASIYLWEEADAGSGQAHSMSHEGPVATISLNELSSPKSVIKAQVWHGGTPIREHWISGADQFSTVPVGIPLPDGYMGIAWLQKNEDGSRSVRYRRMES